MRTTINLDCDILVATKEIVRAESTSLGKVISRLVRQALTGGAARPFTSNLSPNGHGVRAPFEPRGVVVSYELIRR